MVHRNARWTIFAATAAAMAAGCASGAANSKGLRDDAEPEGGPRRALLIGVSAYDEPALRLDFAENDVREIARRLRASPTYGPHDVVVMSTALEPDDPLYPTEDNIWEQLDAVRALQETGGVESFLFFFSGHGGEAGGENYLYPTDIRSNRPAQTGISQAAIEADLEASGAAQRFLILDACRNPVGQKGDGVEKGIEREQISARDPLADEGTWVLYATKGGAFSYEDPSLKMGVLSHFLAEGMKGDADGAGDRAPDGVITIQELADYAHVALSDHAAESGRPQVPYLGGEGAGRFEVLAVPGRRQKIDVPGDGAYAAVSIPAGRFEMGSGTAAHEVAITQSYRVGDAEVTRGLWFDVTGERPWLDPACPDRGLPADPALPATCVSWCDAARFANALSAREGLAKAYSQLDACEADGRVSWNRRAAGWRLPTEAEWEYAARAGGAHGRYVGADEPADACQFGNVGGAFPCDEDREREGLAPIRQYPPNDWGLYDATGNVWEWAWDGHRGDYENDAPSDPTGDDASTYRVLRGGGWYGEPEASTLTYRAWRWPGERVEVVGVRLARSGE